MLLIQVLQPIQGERWAGLALKASALGDPRAYNLWELASNVNDRLQLRILHAGGGTLWIDLEGKALGNLGGAKVLKDK